MGVLVKPLWSNEEFSVWNKLFELFSDVNHTEVALITDEDTITDHIIRELWEMADEVNKSQNL